MKFLYTFIILLASFTANAQKAEIKLEKFSHNFKIIPERQGDVSCTFQYTNTGSIPLKISEIRCEDRSVYADWDKKALAPGESSHIRITLDPRDKSGIYLQSIAVFTNTHPNANTLTIRGFITPQEKGPFDNVPYRVGQLRFEDESFNIGEISAGNSGEVSYRFINAGKETITPSIANLPEHFTAEFIPKTLKPMESGKLILKWEVKHHAKSQNIEHGLEINCTENTKGSIPLLYTIAGGRHSDSKRPSINMDTKELDLGRITCNETVCFEIEIENTGEEKLVIPQIETPGHNIRCSCKKSIKGSKSVKCHIRLKASEKPDRYKGEIIFHTNDPLHPTCSVDIIYESVEKEK